MYRACCQLKHVYKGFTSKRLHTAPWLYCQCKHKGVDCYICLVFCEFNKSCCFITKKKKKKTKTNKKYINCWLTTKEKTNKKYFEYWRNYFVRNISNKLGEHQHNSFKICHSYRERAIFYFFISHFWNEILFQAII